MTKQWGIAFVSGLVAVGCVGTSHTAVHHPVALRCELAGLRRCSDFAASAVHYSRGNSVPATAALARGLSANIDQTTALRQFAAAVALADTRRTTGEYAAQLRLGVALLEQTVARPEQEGAAPPPPAAAATRPASAGGSMPAAEFSAIATAHAQPPAEPQSWMQSRLVTVPGHEHASPCSFAGLGEMACVRQPLNSVVVTDILVSPGCNHDVVVAAATLGGTPNWLVVAPKHNGVSLHGARLPVTGPQVLTYAIAAAAQQGPPDMRCAITVAWQPQALFESESLQLPVGASAGSQAQWVQPIVITNPYRTEPRLGKAVMVSNPYRAEFQPHRPPVITNPYR